MADLQTMKSLQKREREKDLVRVKREKTKEARREAAMDKVVVYGRKKFARATGKEV